MRLLIVNDILPNKVNYTSMLFNNVLPILRKHMVVEAFWVLTSDENISDSISYKDVKVIKMSDFNNAVEILEEIKPDLIYVMPGLNIPNYAFIIAAKYLKILTIGGELTTSNFYTTVSRKFLLDYFFEFFKSSKKNKSSRVKMMDNGIEYLKKHIFLLKTKNAVKMNLIQNIKDFIEIVRYHFSPIDKNDLDVLTHPKFQCDLNFLENTSLIKKYVSHGWDETKLVAVGNPSYDEIITRASDIKKKVIGSEQINVLLLTMNFIGGNRNYTLKKVGDIIKEIKKYDNMSLTIKIHPTQENVNEYKSIIQNSDTKVKIYQEEKIIDIIENYDVVISFTSSTASITAALYQKPVIIWNIFNVLGDILLKWKLALECKKISELGEIIKKTQNFSTSLELLNTFKDKFLNNTKGNSAERIAESIIKLLESRLNQKSKIKNNFDQRDV